MRVSGKTGPVGVHKFARFVIAPGRGLRNPTLGAQDVLAAHRHRDVELVIAGRERREPIALAQVPQLGTLDLDEPGPRHLVPAPRLDMLQGTELIMEGMPSFGDPVRSAQPCDLVAGHDRDVRVEIAAAPGRQLDPFLVHGVEEPMHQGIRDRQEQPSRPGRDQPSGQDRRRGGSLRGLEHQPVSLSHVVMLRLLPSMLGSQLLGRPRD
jgi:hypothetical protein